MSACQARVSIDVRSVQSPAARNAVDRRGRAIFRLPPLLRCHSFQLGMGDEQENNANKMRGITIDWSSVVTNAISTLVAAVFVGAAVFMWNSAAEQDKRIQSAVADAESKLTVTDVKQEEVQKALTEQIGALRSAIDVQRAEITRLASLLTNRTDSSAVTAVLSPAKITWDEYLYRGQTNANNLNKQIQEKVQQRSIPRR